MTVTMTLKYVEIFEFLEVVTGILSMEELKWGFPTRVLARLLNDIKNCGFVCTRQKNLHTLTLH